MCTLSKENTHVGIKKISLTGNIETNVDYGIGYAIFWQKTPYSDKNVQNIQRSGAYLQDIICRCIEQSDFLFKTTNDKKFDQAKQKLFESLAVLQKANQQ